MYPEPKSIRSLAQECRIIYRAKSKSYMKSVCSALKLDRAISGGAVGIFRARRMSLINEEVKSASDYQLYFVILGLCVQRVQPDDRNNAIQLYMQKPRFILAVLAMIGAQGCVHQTAMMDPALHNLWRGNPVPEPVFQAATGRWKQDTSLIEMQQAFALLRKGQLSNDDRSQAKHYLEKAVVSFDDLKEPNNFSTAFTADANTPYRGRPYERVLASTMLGILDIADGRCDMALPAFRTAEFLDARWQPFQFGSDAPLVYALSLRCLKQMNASQGDITRAKDGLFRSIRLNQALETIRDTLQEHARDLTQQELPYQIAFLLIDAGISSALMEAPADGDASQILDRVVTDSLRFYVQVLSDRNDPLFESVSKYAEKSMRRVKWLTQSVTHPCVPKQRLFSMESAQKFARKVNTIKSRASFLQARNQPDLALRL